MWIPSLLTLCWTAWTTTGTNSCNNMPGFQTVSVVFSIFQILTQSNLWIFRFEQEFINSLIRKHTKVEEKYFWTGLQDIGQSGIYSWGTVDGEKAEAVTYTNWNSLQPGKFNNKKKKHKNTVTLHWASIGVPCYRTLKHEIKSLFRNI